MNKKQYGFTLMELMITIAIVGIISSIAVGTYTSYIMSSKRTDGRAALQLSASTLEKCRAMYGVYNSANCSILNGATILSTEGLYDIKVVSAASSYTLTASPSSGSSQAKDSLCTSIILNHLGQQTGTPASTNDCW